MWPSSDVCFKEEVKAMKHSKDFIKAIKCIECDNKNFYLKVNYKIKRDIIDGKIICKKCGNFYDIRDGIIIAIPRNLDAQSKLEQNLSDNYSNFENTSYIRGKSIRFFYRNLFSYIDKFNKTKSVVEIGCGNGFFLKYLIYKKLNFKLIMGVDISFNALLNAKKRLVDEIILIQADSNNLPFINNILDNVVTQATLHHIKEAEISLGEINRILKKGGIFAIQDKNLNNFLIPFCNKIILDLLLKNIGISKIAETTLVEKPINHREVKEFLDKNGFKILSFKFHDVIAWPSSIILDFLRLNTKFILSSIVYLDTILLKIPIIMNVFSWKYTIIAEKAEEV